MADALRYPSADLTQGRPVCIMFRQAGARLHHVP